MPGKKKGFSSVSSKIIRSLRARISSTFGNDSNRDLVANPLLLNRLTSYASIVTRKSVICQWGKEHKTNLGNIIILNPYDPEKNAPDADRKIVIDAALEHEIRCHWQHTPRQVFETVVSVSEGHSEVSNQDYWKVPEHASRLPPILQVFNILEDGRAETRVRWEQPAVYEIIAAGDRIRPRWKRESVYRAAKKAHTVISNKLKNHQIIKCKTCGKNDSHEGVACEACFTEQYRWEQITGILLLAALPPHTTPLNVVEPEVRVAFQECFPLLLNILRGTAKDCKDYSLEILKILIKHGMVPPKPDNNHLNTNDATGHPDAKDTKMPQKIIQHSGLSESVSKNTKNSANKNNESNQNKSNSASGKKSGGKSGQNNKPEKDELDHQPDSSQADKSDSKDSAENSPLPELDQLANHDLQDFDFDVQLDIEKIRREAQAVINNLQYNQDAQKAYDLILGVSGIGAGPGIDRNIRRVQPNAILYEFLRVRNLELGRRFAREIDDLVHSLSQVQRYQRAGRLDRKQLVNAVARGKNTVFIRPKVHYKLDLAATISVDLSGSMSAYNRTINPKETYRPSPAQLADAVATCSIGFERLKVPYEVRAFGSYQWLVKGFYDHDPSGVGGMAGTDNGGTDMLPAVDYATIAMFGRQEKDRLIVIMTDGWPSNVQATADKIRAAKLMGNRVLGILFDNLTENRNQVDPAMSSLFGPNGFTVIHSLDEFPRVVGNAVKEIIKKGFVLAKE